MDLVSSTLEKYLKHRFNNTNGVERNLVNPSPSAESSDQSQSMIVPMQTDGVPSMTTSDVTSPSVINTTNQPHRDAQDNDRTTNLALVASMNQVPTQQPLTQTTATMTSETKLTSASMSNGYTNQESGLNVDKIFREQEPQLLKLKQHQHQDSNQSTVTNNHITSNGTSINSTKVEPMIEDEYKLPSISQVIISNLRPCCVALREDFLYLAAGFENSFIYLWTLEKKNDSSILSIGLKSPLIAHSGSVYSIQFFDNNDLMLSCSEDTTVRLWCLKTKCNVGVYRGHNYPIWSLDIGNQGNFFASASMDSTARLWRIDMEYPLRIFCGHEDDVECIKFHPNEKYLATGSSDATVRLWSVSDGKMVRLMVGHQHPIISLSFLPNGKFLASASRDGVIKVWNLATNTVTNELTVPASFTISFSPDQQFVSSCGTDNVVHLWQIEGTDLIEKKRLDLKAQAKHLIQSQFHRDNKLFVIGHIARAH